MWKAAPALAAGNVMVLKPSEETPLSVLKLAEIFTEAGLPAGVFNVVQGDYRVGQMLTAHPHIAKISFTGEVGTGKTVMAASDSSLKSVTMELGGKSPMIIFDDCKLDDAVSAAMVPTFILRAKCVPRARVIYSHSHQLIRQMVQKAVTGWVFNSRVPDHPDIPASVTVR